MAYLTKCWVSNWHTNSIGILFEQIEMIKNNK